MTAAPDYAEEAAWYGALLREHVRRPLQRVLELGCGAGANASHLRRSLEVVGVDLAPAMLKECARLNPDMELHEGDMRTIRLGRRFDAVFVHDALSYMLDESDARAVVNTVVAHLEPGGIALLCPDDTWENFTPGTESGGHDAPDGRGVRYLDWSTPGPATTIHTDYAYILRAPDGTVRVEHERHVTGRLHQATWLSAMKDSGLESQMLELEHSEVESGSHHVFVGVRPRDSHDG